ncbi:MAG: YegP family protein [Bacteroidales bacterium]|nr:YegP family protein [Bacteroidales bacterium]MBR3287600.1 YegP family protein [Bacteroidales bacterium]
MGKFEVTIRKNGDYQFNLKASNGQVILSSQGYKSKVSCMNGIESVRKNSQSIERFDKKVAANGKPYFNLMATNGQVIGSSQMYASEATCANGIASVMKNAPDAVIVEIPAEE